MIAPNDKKDFLDFVNSQSQSSPEKLDKSILNFVKNELNPSHQVVILKLFIIQASVGILTLLFCPQFELSLTNNYKLFYFLHHNFGAHICMAICGCIFIGSGASISSYILKPAEIRKISKFKTIYFASVTIVMLASFFTLGANMNLVPTLFWISGAILGGVTLFEVNQKLRLQLLQN